MTFEHCVKITEIQNNETIYMYIPHIRIDQTITANSIKSICSAS